MSEQTARYYARRAAEYDRIYALPQWQRDLATLEARIAAAFAGRRVFEAACGTGHWTRHAARVAMCVRGMDLNEEPLAIARARGWQGVDVEFRRGDAYAPPDDPERFDAGLAGFWLSHVDRARMGDFLAAFHARLLPGSPVLMFDERPTPDRRPAASRSDAAGNRYERRRLASGARFEIIKNFYDGPRLAALVEPYAHDLAYEELDHLWLLAYRTAS